MRFALSTLIVAAGLATSAFAQTPVPAPAETAPAAVAPEPPAIPAPPPAVAEPAPPPPTLPTTGNGAEAIAALEKVCVPLVRGQPLDVLAKANGFRLNRREQTWSKQLGPEKGYQIIISPPGSNKGLCFAELRYPTGADVEISKTLNLWAFVRQPPLDPTANYTQPQDPDGLKRVRRSWEYLTSTESVGLNFSTVRKADDTQLNPKYDTGNLQYQERKF